MASLWAPGRILPGHDWENRGYDYRGPLVGAEYRRRSPPAGALRHPAHRGLVPSRQLPRCCAAVGGPAGGHDAFYFVPDLHAITVDARPGDARRAHPDAASRSCSRRARPGPLHGVRPEPRARARAAGVGAGLHHRVRRGEPDDAVQGQVGEAAADRTTVGLFTYPILQAADILLYQADRVPVGEDQRQHVELTRDLAKRFNTRYGPTFTVPEPYILAGAAKIHDLQDPSAKMSKSSSTPAGTSTCSTTRRSARRRSGAPSPTPEREIRYDPQNKPGVSNLLTIYSGLTDRKISELEGEYAGRGYGDLKKDLAEVVAAFAEPLAARSAYLDDPAELDRVLAAGAARARELAGRRSTCTSGWGSSLRCVEVSDRPGAGRSVSGRDVKVPAAPRPLRMARPSRRRRPLHRTARGSLCGGGDVLQCFVARPAPDGRVRRGGVRAARPARAARAAAERHHHGRPRRAGRNAERRHPRRPSPPPEPSVRSACSPRCTQASAG